MPLLSPGSQPDGPANNSPYARALNSELLGLAFSPAVTGLWQNVFQLGAGSPRIGVGRQGKLLGDDFADIEHISRQGLGGIGLGIQHRLTAFRVAVVGHIGLEDDAERVVEILRHRIEGEHAGLHNAAPQAAFDHDLVADAAIDGHPGGKDRQAQEAEALGQGGPLAVAGWLSARYGWAGIKGLGRDEPERAAIERGKVGS